MSGRLSQYSGIHDFVTALSMPNALVNHIGDLSLEGYNAAPTTQLALFQQEEGFLHADMVRWGWRPHWAKDRAPPSMLEWRKSHKGRSFVPSGRIDLLSRSTTGSSG